MNKLYAFEVGIIRNIILVFLSMCMFLCLRRQVVVTKTLHYTRTKSLWNADNTNATNIFYNGKIAPLLWTYWGSKMYKNVRTNFPHLFHSFHIHSLYLLINILSLSRVFLSRKFKMKGFLCSHSAVACPPFCVCQTTTYHWLKRVTLVYIPPDPIRMSGAEEQPSRESVFFLLSTL